VRGRESTQQRILPEWNPPCEESTQENPEENLPAENPPRGESRLPPHPFFLPYPPPREMPECVVTMVGWQGRGGEEEQRALLMELPQSQSTSFPLFTASTHSGRGRGEGEGGWEGDGEPTTRAD
jgi:hypothetical protein